MGDWSSIWASLLPQPDRLLALAAVAAVALLATGLGRLLALARRPAEAFLAGWGAALFVFIVAGTLTPLSFRIVAAVLAGASLLGLILLWRDVRADASAAAMLLRVLVLATPLIVIAGAMRSPSQWDELSHWVPNAQFLAAHDRFPSAILPNPDSVLPAYPHAIALYSYAVSLVLGHFSAIAGAMANLLLLVALGAVIAELIASERPTTSRLGRWGLAAAGLLIAIPFNPGFLVKIALTNYGDSGSAVSLAVAGVLALRWIETRESDLGEARRLVLATGTVLTLLVGLRPANLVLVAGLFAGVAFALLVRGRLFERRAASGLLALLMPVLTAALWDHYANLEMSEGVRRALPIASWNFDHVHAMLASMLRIALSKGYHFGLLLVLMALAALTLVRPGILGERARSLCQILAVVFLAYTSFLFFAYLAAFPGVEADHAASFWRYSSHLSPLMAITALTVALPWWRLPARHARTAAIAAIVAIVVLPAAALPYLRFDVEHRHDGYLLAVARDLEALLPPGAHLALLDPDASRSNLLLVRYHLRFDRRHDLAVTMEASPDAVAAFAAGDGDYVWLTRGGAGVPQRLGAQTPPGASYLFRYDEGGYRLVRAWPDTAAEERFASADFGG